MKGLPTTRSTPGTPSTSAARCRGCKAICRTYFRGEVEGLENIPVGEPSLLVGNHSGGLLIADTFVFSAAFYDHFGPDRRFHQLAHDVAAKSPLLGLIRRYGVVPASHDNARAAFDLGAPVLVYPGGDYETFRPSWHGDQIEFGGRQGFVGSRSSATSRSSRWSRSAGRRPRCSSPAAQRAAKLIGLDKLTRIKVLPVSIGPPLGINLLDFPGRIPLPAKIKIQVLPPIDLRERYGADPDPDEAYEEITARCRTRSARWTRSGRCPSSADRRHPDVDREPEHEQGEHGVEGGDAGLVVARADQHDLDRHQHEQPEAHADRARGARADQREDEQQDRRGVDHPAEALVRVEALGAEDAERRQETPARRWRRRSEGRASSRRW